MELSSQAIEKLINVQLVDITETPKILGFNENELAIIFLMSFNDIKSYFLLISAMLKFAPLFIYSPSLQSSQSSSSDDGISY